VAGPGEVGGGNGAGEIQIGIALQRHVRGQPRIGNRADETGGRHVGQAVAAAEKFVAVTLPEKITLLVSSATLVESSELGMVPVRFVTGNGVVSTPRWRR